MFQGSSRCMGTFHVFPPFHKGIQYNFCDFLFLSLDDEARFAKFQNMFHLSYIVDPAQYEPPHLER